MINSEDYQRIAKAIAFIHKHHLSQPDLTTVAQHIGLSEYHFQRLFTRWAGISPKRFLQYVTLEYAKSKINQTKSLLDLTLDTGLSSPGRLHDLFVNLEAMSPGEYKAGGKGLQIRYGVHDTPFGKSLIATTTRGICNLHFLDLAQEKTPEEILRQSWSNAEIVGDRDATQPLCERIFNSTTLENQKPLTLLVKGTNFQIQVWRALLRIPFGEVTTYKTIANAIARPTATRAVGNAVGKNPIGYLIPCINLALPFLLFAFASIYLPAGFNSILNATSPLFGTVVAAIWFQEKLTISRIIGLVLGFAGVTILIGMKTLETTPFFWAATGAGLMAALLYAIAAPYAKRRLSGVSPVVIATMSQLSAAIFLLPALPFTLPKTIPSLDVMLSVLALAIFSTAIAYLLYFRLIQNIGSTKALTVTYLIPIFAVIWGRLFLKEPITSSIILGCSLILLGTAIANNSFQWRH